MSYSAKSPAEAGDLHNAAVTRKPFDQLLAVEVERPHITVLKKPEVFSSELVEESRRCARKCGRHIFVVGLEKICL